MFQVKASNLVIFVKISHRKGKIAQKFKYHNICISKIWIITYFTFLIQTNWIKCSAEQHNLLIPKHLSNKIKRSHLVELLHQTITNLCILVVKEHIPWFLNRDKRGLMGQTGSNGDKWNQTLTVVLILYPIYQVQ